MALVALCGIFLYTTLLALLQAGPILDRARLHLEQNVQILDRKGGVLYQFAADQNRVFLPAEKLPDILKSSIIAIEDERFLSRTPCIDVRSVLRAVSTNYFTNRTEGASTITQQLVRTLYLTPEKSYTRKFYEVILSCRLESMLSKEEILTLYMNGVGFGNGIYGVEQAAQTYFGIPASKISLAQSAVLASIPQRPTYFSPYGIHLRTTIERSALRLLKTGVMKEGDLPAEDFHIGLLPRVVRTSEGEVRLEGRSDAVLASMLRLGLVTQEMYDDAKKDLLTMTFQKFAHPISAPHFSLWMRDEVESLLRSLEQPDRWRAAGLKVHTTLDPSLQFIAEDTLQHHKKLLEKNGAKNAALVAIDRVTREVVAYIGNADFFGNALDGQIDMARVPRQPGSSFKPIVYAAAFEKGYTPDTRINDEPMRIGSDEPKNYDGNFKGWMFVRDAIGQSRNIPAIKAFVDAGGEDVVLDLASRAGAFTPSNFKKEMQKNDAYFSYGWPMAIGALEVPLLEMVQMYATIASHGLFTPLTYLCSVEDSKGQGSLPMFQIPSMQAIIPEAADGVTSVLIDDQTKPEGYWRSILTVPGIIVGAKTGTSNLCFERDAFGGCMRYGVNNVWTIGFTDKLVVGVWAGNADASALGDLADGLTVAAPIWKEFLERSSEVYELNGECSSPNV